MLCLMILKWKFKPFYCGKGDKHIENIKDVYILQDT